ncbi:MAG: sigma-54-dependent Fis family transcriptional regulator [Balneola sp.]|jgi:DNA-binding NtrC family response regulator|nr:sigma-54-dependent Fis family transcriptional regulator [Balneola sp.]MAO76233.1 sigma-54-dependent Fis family transcriptional regulator [Balneola sp.]MBF63916.1 sigma-54-dependent Fis family transcriptional regulator [Balneola sp.]|tara:strand:- start:21338 stop:22714 length:1377 start_codon:yes stop_codon:yes gene_type:complete
MTSKKGKILVVDDDADVLQAARLFLKQHVKSIETEKDPNSIPTLLKNNRYDLILLDMNFTEDVSSGKEGFFWLQEILKIDPSIAVILITAYGDIDKAVQAVKAGATDFVLKPWKNEKLLTTVMSAMQLTDSKREVAELKETQKQINSDIDHHYRDIIGRSPAMINVFNTIEKVAATDANVLILGENGTGKEVIARALHRRSARHENVFMNVDMGAITESLFESELFGYVKGAFTDAKEDKAGRFELANGGTLFLDEIGNLPLPLQSKLLTVLQNRKVNRVGSAKSKEIDIRLVCATNQSLKEMVADSTFRQDLLFRINTIEIQLPPLRDRIEDIEALTDHFIKLYSKKYKKEVSGCSKETIKKLEKHSWPGNVRELQHSVERAVIMSESAILKPGDFLLTPEAGDSEQVVFDDYNLEEVEKMVLRKALKKHEGNISKAAEELGLTRASLYRRMDKYGL